MKKIFSFLLLLFCVVQGTAVAQETDDYAINTSEAITSTDTSEKYTEPTPVGSTAWKIAKQVFAVLLMIAATILVVVGVLYYLKKDKDGAEVKKYNILQSDVDIENVADNNNSKFEVDIENGPDNNNFEEKINKIEKEVYDNDSDSVIVPLSTPINSINDLDDSDVDNKEFKNNDQENLPTPTLQEFLTEKGLGKHYNALNETGKFNNDLGCFLKKPENELRAILDTLKNNNLLKIGTKSRIIGAYKSANEANDPFTGNSDED